MGRYRNLSNGIWTYNEISIPLKQISQTSPYEIQFFYHQKTLKIIKICHSKFPLQHLKESSQFPSNKRKTFYEKIISCLFYFFHRIFFMFLNVEKENEIQLKEVIIFVVFFYFQDRKKYWGTLFLWIFGRLLDGGKEERSKGVWLAQMLAIWDEFATKGIQC